MGQTFIINIAGITRTLPVIQVAPDMCIASFVILGDTEMVSRAADALIPLLPDADYLVTAEAKGIPLAHALAERMLMPRYIVARKSVKAYMDDPLEADVQSITTANQQKLYLDREDARRIFGRSVILVDDVISTGQSIDGIRRLVLQAGAKVVATACILIEGDNQHDIIHLGHLPLFNGKGDIISSSHAGLD
jgi:adenine phosphoribosyltransferase